MIEPYKRSAFPFLRGFNSIVSIFFGIIFSFLSLIVKHNQLLSPPSWPTGIVLVCGAIFCVLFVRYSSLFTAATQAPLLIVSSLACYYIVSFHLPLRQKILTVGMQLAQFFPLMSLAFGVSIVVALIRWFIHYQTVLRKPASAAPASTASSSSTAAKKPSAFTEKRVSRDKVAANQGASAQSTAKKRPAASSGINASHSERRQAKERMAHAHSPNTVPASSGKSATVRESHALSSTSPTYSKRSATSPRNNVARPVQGYSSSIATRVPGEKTRSPNSASLKLDNTDTHVQVRAERGSHTKTRPLGSAES